MKIFMACILLILMIEEAIAIDQYLHGYAPRYTERQKPYYVFTTPDTVHPGESFNVGVAMSQRRTDVFMHVKLVTWHGQDILASAERIIPIVHSGEPFVFHLTTKRDAKDGFAILVIRMWQNSYIEKKRMIRIQREKPKIFVRTHKGFYKPGENVQLWILALNRYSMPYRGKIESLELRNLDDNLIDYVSDHRLKDGIASLSLSTKNVLEEGKHIIQFKINNHETRILINIGNKQGDFKNNISNKENGTSANKEVSSKNEPAGFFREQFPSSKMIKIIMPRTSFEVNDKAEVIVIYSNPKNGLNEFQYEVICSGQIYLHGKQYDIYSSWFCRGGIFRIRDTFDIGPTSDEMCKNGQTRFSFNFHVEKEMAPHCKILLYQVQGNGKVIANMQSFNVCVKPNANLNLQLNRRQVDTNEDLALDIPNPDAGTLVLIMGLANDLRGDNSYGIITNKNLRHYLASGMETENNWPYSYCKRNMTAGQLFKACGVKAISNLNINSKVACKGRRYVRDKMRANKPIQISGRNIQPWIWKTSSIQKHEKWHTTLKAPSKAGTYNLDAIFVSTLKGVSFANRLSITVVEKASTRKSESKETPKLGIITQNVPIKHYITVKIQRNMDKNMFLLHRCQPLQLQLCIRASEISSDYISIKVNLVRNFQFNKEDLKRAYSSKNVLFYVSMGHNAMLFVKRPKFGKECFHIKLDQIGPFEESFSRGTTTYSTRQNNGKWRTIQYWITKMDCNGF